MYIGLHKYSLYIYIIHRGANPSLPTTTTKRHTTLYVSMYILFMYIIDVSDVGVMNHYMEHVGKKERERESER